MRVELVTPRSIKLVGEPFSKSDISDLVAWLQQEPTPQLTQGPLVREFEEKFAAWLGRKHAVMVNSGSSALFAAYYAASFLGGKPGGVIAPSVAWPTTVAPALQLRQWVDLVNVGRDWAVSYSALEGAVRSHKPNVVTIVDVLGVPANRDAVLELKKEHPFTLIEDCCGAHGSTWRGKKVGTFGELACFSFHVNHAVTTIEGGMVVTDDVHLSNRLRMIRAHGWAADLGPDLMSGYARAENVDPFREKFTFYLPGMNIRSTDLQARIGLSQLERIDEIVTRRAVNDRIYRRLLKSVPGVVTQAISEVAFVSSIAVGILVPDRAKVAKALADAGVETRPVGGGNMHRQPFMPVSRTSSYDPIADAIHDRGLQLPNHPDLTEDDITYIVEAVRKGVEG